MYISSALRYRLCVGYPLKNSQAACKKKSAAIKKSWIKKSCEIKGGYQLIKKPVLEIDNKYQYWM